MMAAVVAAVAAATLVAGVLIWVDDGGEGPTPATGRTTTTTSATTPTTGASTTMASTTTATTAPSSSTTRSTSPAVAIRRGPTRRPVVALTFDAGSDVGSAAAILDRLDANGIRASFGVTGEWAEANPGLVARMAAEGHQLLNHSFDHPSFTGRSTGKAPLSRGDRLDQLARAEAAIVAASGTAARPWFRPPYGDEDESVRADVGSAGYRYEALWTVDSLGWKGLAPAAVVARCLAGAGRGAIYLLHVGAASTDADALQPLIDGLRKEGYGFVTLTALLAS
jgi:peptidoglycan/xylan/chitin deacetylase (PgdA/CDA1 family)